MLSIGVRPQKGAIKTLLSTLAPHYSSGKLPLLGAFKRAMYFPYGFKRENNQGEYLQGREDRAELHRLPFDQGIV